ncbi:MAG: DUF4830 domain-containing protein [Clostridia bacterium]|nr:DUF4830 domain-containing protein [Clostridia bacterium]
MKIFLTLSKRSLAVILAVLLIVIILCAQYLSSTAAKIDGSTHAKRMTYLNSVKLFVDDSSFSKKEILIPETFSPTFESYNNLQKKSGFDLKKHKGKYATVYSYPLGRSQTVNLIVLKGEIIGGDISENKAGGEIKGLIKGTI